MSLISMVMPVFELEYGAYRFTRAIANIARQRHKDWELIIVIDGKDHKTIDLVKRNALSRDPRIRAVMLPQNQGSCIAYNVGFWQAKGEYVVFHDQDDISSVDRLKGLLSAMEAGNHDVVASTIEVTRKNPFTGGSSTKKVARYSGGFWER